MKTLFDPTRPGELTHPNYRPDIDGMRAIAILSVVAFHAFPSISPGGFTGVDVFFVISGFLISHIIFRNMNSGSFSFKEFYYRRIRRIFPALTIVLAACLLFGWFALLSGEYKQLGKHVAGGSVFISNLILWHESGYFDNSSATKPLLHLWSLGVEEQFYIFFPLFIWIAYKIRINLLIPVLLAALISFGLDVSEVHTSAAAAVGAFYSPVTRLWELMMGAVLSSIYRSRPMEQEGSLVKNSQSILGFLFIVIPLFALTQAHALRWTVLTTIGASLVIYAGPRAWLNRMILSNRVLVWFGLISYPLYLWHWPLLSFARIIQSQTPSLVIRCCAISMSIVLAWLTYRWVEVPVRHGKHGPLQVFMLCLFMAGIGSAGYYVYRDNGLDFRAANANEKLYADIITPYQTRSSDGSCERRIGLRKEINETCLTKSSHPNIMFMGDSHAMAFNSAAYMGMSKLNTITLSGHGCLPFTKYAAKSCQDIARLALDVVKSQHSIKTVVLVNEGANAYLVKHYEDGAKNIDPEVAFVNGYSDVIGKLLALKKHVVLTIDVPGLGVDPKSCMPGRPFTFSERPAGSCITPKKIVDERNREYRKLITKISHKYPSVLIYNAQDAFCDANYCYGKNDQHIYYFDTNHLSLSGSKRLLANFQTWLGQKGLLSPDSFLLKPSHPELTVLVNDSPLFRKQGKWSAGYLMAIGHGNGVVVGPGASNPNVFAQKFQAKPHDAFKVVARASSVDKPSAVARIQINWTDANGKFISSSAQSYPVTQEERAFKYYAVAPSSAANGTLYVVAGSADSVVRYTEMKLLGKR